MRKINFFTTKYFIISACIIVSACILLAGCAGSGTLAVEPYTAGHNNLVQAQEYHDAGRLIMAVLKSGNVEAFNKILYKKALLDRTFRDIPFDSQYEDVRAKLDGVLQRAGIVMTKNLGGKTRLTFVQSRNVMGENRALVRIDMGNRGLSYIDFVLGKDEDGDARIIDWYDYSQGQLYSESLLQSIVLMLPRNQSLFAEIFGGTWNDMSSVSSFSELARLSEEHRYSEWLEKYGDLPEALKYSRIFLVTRVLIASAAGSESDYRAALRDVNARLGDDPSLSFMLLDHYLNERDYAAAHRALDRLYEYTGGDAAIDLLKANVFLTEKKYTESIKYAQRAIKVDPSLEDAYWTLLAVSVYSGQYNIAIGTLRHLERSFGYSFEPNEIAGIKGYEEFARSSIFNDWKYGMMP